MCEIIKYEKCLYNANNELIKLMNLTGLFYPETSSPNKISEFKKDSFSNACESVLFALEELDKLNSKKKYSDEHLAEKIYDTLDEKWYFIFNIQVIIGSIRREREQLLRMLEYPDLSIVAGYFLELHDILIDVSTFLIQFANWKGIDTSSWPMAIMRRQVLPFEVFSSGIYISKRMVHLNDFSIPPLAIFLMRQAIELRVCEILNIYIVTDNDNNIIKITGDKFIPLLNESNFVLPVKKSILEKIHKWANEYVHLGSIDYFWKIEFAQFYLRDFFAINRKVYALKSYYEEGIQEDIQKIVKGNFKIIPLRKEPLYVELLESDVFNEVQTAVSTIGFKKFIKQKEKDYYDKLMR